MGEPNAAIRPHQRTAFSRRGFANGFALIIACVKSVPLSPSSTNHVTFVQLPITMPHFARNGHCLGMHVGEPTPELIPITRVERRAVGGPTWDRFLIARALQFER